MFIEAYSKLDKFNIMLLVKDKEVLKKKMNRSKKESTKRYSEILDINDLDRLPDEDYISREQYASEMEGQIKGEVNGGKRRKNKKRKQKRKSTNKSRKQNYLFKYKRWIKEAFQCLY